ncbi:MAG TPA: lipopolysaccharide kinase InaA family protein [Steroidobacteraceae bacterium]|nr:lipopolysaccharide kinase InaA family protein [Steroidobacteraceae bacterium]
MNDAVSLAQQHLYKAEPGTLIWSEPLAGGGSAVVKLYRRRGLLDPVRRRFVAYRAEREYQLLQRLREHGVACPEPLGWSHGSCRAHGRFERLDTREIERAVPLTDLFGSPASPDLAPLFALVRRLHAAGIAHGALYARNVLVARWSGTGPQYFLIDLAHGRTFSRDLMGSRPADYDLLDLLLSLARQGPLSAAGEWLASYGLTPDAARALLERLAHHRNERPWRHFRRIETDARAMLDALRPGASRAPATAR